MYKDNATRKNVSGPLLGPGGLPNPAEASGVFERQVLGCRGTASAVFVYLQHVREPDEHPESRRRSACGREPR